MRKSSFLFSYKLVVSVHGRSVPGCTRLQFPTSRLGYGSSRCGIERFAGFTEGGVKPHNAIVGFREQSQCFPPCCTAGVGSPAAAPQLSVRPSMSRSSPVCRPFPSSRPRAGGFFSPCPGVHRSFLLGLCIPSLNSPWAGVALGTQQRIPKPRVGFSRDCVWCENHSFPLMTLRNV